MPDCPVRLVMRACMRFYERAENLSLIVQPGDSFFSVVDAIDSAARCIRMTV